MNTISIFACLLSIATGGVLGSVVHEQAPLGHVKSRWDIAVSNDTDCYAMSGRAGLHDTSCHTIRKADFVTVRITGNCTLAVVDGTDCDADAQNFDADNGAECLEGKWESFYVYGCDG